MHKLAKVRVAGEKQHLVALGSLGENLGDRSRTFRIEVHQHVVEDQGEGLGPFGKGLREPDSQAEVELLDAATAQCAGFELGPRRGDDPDRLTAALVCDRGQQLHIAALGHLGESLSRASKHGGLALLLMATQGALEQQAGTSEEGPGLQHLVELLLERELCLLELRDLCRARQGPQLVRRVLVRSDQSLEVLAGIGTGARERRLLLVPSEHSAALELGSQTTRFGPEPERALEFCFAVLDRTQDRGSRRSALAHLLEHGVQLFQDPRRVGPERVEVTAQLAEPARERVEANLEGGNLHAKLADAGVHSIEGAQMFPSGLKRGEALERAIGRQHRSQPVGGLPGAEPGPFGLQLA